MRTSASQTRLCSTSRNGRFLRPVSLSLRMWSSTRAPPAMTAFDQRDVVVGLVGEDRLEAMTVVVVEGQLRAGMRAFAADEDPRPVRPTGELAQAGDLGDLPVGSLGAVLIKQR